MRRCISRYRNVRFLIILSCEVSMKYLFAVTAAFVLALAVSLSRPEFVFGGEWLLLLMAPGGVWVLEDLNGSNGF